MGNRTPPNSRHREIGFISRINVTVSEKIRRQLERWAEDNGTNMSFEMKRSTLFRMRDEKVSQARIDQLQADLDKERGSHQSLIDRVAELENILGINQSMVTRLRGAFGLSESEAKILGILLNRQVITKEALYAALYGPRPDCDQPTWKIIDVWLHKLRRKLRDCKIEIGCVVGDGYTIKPEHKLRVRELLAAHEGEERPQSTTDYIRSVAEKYGENDFPTILIAPPRAVA